MADAPAKKALPVLRPTAMRGNGADYVRTYHHVVVPVETTKDDVLRPGFWAHHTAIMRPGDLIDVLSEDGGLDMQVRVVGKDIGMVHVRPLRIWEREAIKPAPASKDETADDAVPDGYKVNFAPSQKWRVMTENPHQVIQINIASKAEAIAKAKEHAALAGVAA